MTNRCPQCGMTFPGENLQGHCPRCLAGVALDIEVDFCDRSMAFPRAFGDYELLEEVGRGGMGVVYRARQKSLKREVALKMILAGEFASAEFVSRFRHEATAAASLQHPNIVAIHEVGEVEGQQYFSMDLVEGQSLTELARSEPLDARRAAEYVKAIAEAIYYAHTRGILHRDLKPSNVLIDPFGQPRVMDFGLAKEFRSSSELTRHGQMIGSPAYMAPEQASGRADAIGPASDVYSLGAMLYHLLTTRPPFQGATLHQVLLQVQTAEPIGPRRLNPGVPEDLQNICLKCLEKELQRRYASAMDLAQDLGRFIAGEPVKARPVGPPGRVWRWCKREPVIAALSAFAVVLLLAMALGAGFAAWRIEAARRGEHHEREKAVLANAGLERANSQLGESVSFLALQRAEGFFRACDASMGLAQLAAVLRRDPSNHVAAERILSALLHRNWVLPTGPALEHHDFVSSVVFSPQGEYVVTGCADGFARVWSVGTRQEIGHRLAHGRRVRGACFSPDESTIATTCDDGKLRIWDWRANRLTLEIPAHSAWALAVSYSPDGKRILTSSADGTAKVWDAQTGALLLTLSGHSKWVWQAVFSPDGNLIATAGYDGSVRLWNSLSGQSIGAPFRHKATDPVLGVAFSPDGALLATSSRDRTATIWDIQNGARPIISLQHPDGLNDIQFDPNGQLLATTSFDNSVRLWDLETGRVLSQPFRHREQAEKAAFSPNGGLLATASDDGTVKFWEVRPGAAITTVMRHTKQGPGVKSLDLSRDGKWLATVSAGVRIWDTQTGKETESIDVGAPVQSASFSHDGELLAIATTNGFATVWERKTAKKIGGPFFHDSTIWSVCFSPDGQRLLTASSDHRARMWDIKASERALFSVRHKRDIMAARFSRDGTRIVTASVDHTARVWDAATGAPVTESLVHTDECLDACFSPDGKFVATASKDNAARIWNASTGEFVGKAMQHLRSVEAIAFSPDGLRVVTASLDHTARIWDARTGVPLSPPLEHEEAVLSACFSPNGKRVLTTSLDRMARLWDAQTGLPASDPLPHEGPVHTGCFSRDGEAVITGAMSPENGARIWHVPSASTPVPDWLPELAEAVAGLAVGPLGAPHMSVEDRLEQVKRRVNDSKAGDNFTRVARWFFADRGARTISASDRATVREYVQQRIAENTIASLQEAIRFEPTNALALGRLALAKLATKRDEAEHLAKRALRFSPSQHEARDVLDRISRAATASAAK